MGERILLSSQRCALLQCQLHVTFMEIINRTWLLVLSGTYGTSLSVCQHCCVLHCCAVQWSHIVADEPHQSACYPQTCAWKSLPLQ